ALATSMLAFRKKYPALSDQAGHRLHCVAYSDWLGLPTAEHQWGIRLDMNYYNWPPGWIQDRPGYITGSALPMRFSDDNGRMLDVFQQESHLVSETWNGSAAAIEELITAAEDERGYYGAFGTHYDFSDGFDEMLMDVAIRRDIPMVSAQQLLDFTEGRQASSFTNVEQTVARDLMFDVEVDPRVGGMLRAMLPVKSGGKVLTSLVADENTVEYDVKSIKGISYAFFEADDSRYTAGYR
ncbi:MAG: putatively exported protein, partial [Microbacteriaceae bacterium]|nr:putatively exported protein [Microbacteriaceae bacterium]